MEWSNKIGSRERKPWLLLIKNGKVTPFAGESIPGLVAVVGSQYEKCGKWSHTTFALELADGVSAISGRDGWETGRFIEGLGADIRRWPDVAEKLGVPVTEAMRFLRGWRPKAAEALDQVESDLEALEGGEDDDAEQITISFGSPTSREIQNGFWKLPKPIQGTNGKVELIDPAGWWEKENVRVAGIPGTVIDVQRAAGYHGGYVTVVVAVINTGETQ